MTSKQNMIYGSTLDQTNITTKLNAKNTLVNTLTDGYATLSNNSLVGLNDPLGPQYGISKQYVDDYILSNPVEVVAGPEGAIQYNTMSTFGGSVDLVWTTSNNTLTATSISDGILTWTDTNIIGIDDPIYDDDISNKRYCDTSYNVTQTYIDINENTEYLAEDTVNGIIYRTAYSSVLIDLTPTAVDIIANMRNTSVDSTSMFTVKNVSSDNNKILIVPNIGISIYSNRNTSGSLQKQLYVSLYKNYEVSFKIIIESDTEVSLIIEGITFLQSTSSISSTTQFINNQFLIQQTDNLFTNILLVQSNFSFNFNVTNLPTDTNITYSENAILGSYIIRGPGLTADRTDSLTNSSNLLLKVPYPYQPTNIKENNPTGLVFKVYNKDPTYNIIINISSIGYTPDYILGSNPIIGPGLTGIIGISFARINYINTAYIYLIGIV